MAVGEELGVGYVTLTVSTKGLGKDIAKQFRDAEKQAGRSGRRMGKEVSDEFNDAVDLSELERKVAIAEAKATKAIEDAARDQAKAKERVAVAEAKAAAAAARNAEAQDKAADKSARAVSKVSLEQRKLAAARLKAENAAKDQEAAEKRLQVVLEESGEDSEDAVKATRELDRAREKAADTSVKAAAAENRLTDAKQAAVDADRAATRAAEDAADARDDLARNVDEAKRAYDDASRAARLAADSESELQRELRDTKRAYQEAADAAERGGKDAQEEYREGWKGLAKHLGRQVRDAVDKALDSVSVVGQGIAHGVAYAESFKAGMKSVHIGNPASGVSALAGGRGLGDMGRGFKDMVVNMDRAIPKISLVAAGLASLSGAAIAGAGGLVGIAAGLGSIAAVGLVLPGTLAGIVAGASVLAMAFADVTEVLKDLGPRFVELQDVVSANFWEVAAQPIRDLANKVLPVLVTGLGAVSTEFGVMARAIANTLGTDENIGFLTQQIEYLREAVDIAGEGAVYFTDALMKLGTVGASYLPNLASWLTIVGENFDTWVEKSMASGEIFGWIDTGIENLKALGWIVVSTVGIFHALGEAAANAGSGGLIGLADGMRAVNEAMHGDVFQGAMTNVFIGAGIGMQHIGDGLSALGDAFVNLAPTIAGVLGLAGEAIGTLIEGIATAIQQPIFKQGLLDFFLGIKRGADELTPAMGPLGDLFGTLGSLAGAMAENFGRVLSVAIQELSPIFIDLMNAVKPLIPIMGDLLIKAIETVAPFLRDVAQWISDFATNSPGSAAALALIAGAFGLIGGLLIKVAPLLFTVGKIVGDVVGKFGGMGKAVGAVSKAFKIFGGPVAWVIGGLSLLVGAIIHAWNTNEDFRTAVMDLGAALGDMFRVIGEVLMPVLGFLAQVVGTVLVAAFEFLTPILTFFVQLLTWVAEAITEKLTLAMIGFRDYVVPAFQTAIQWLGDAFGWLGDKASVIWQWIKDAANNVAMWFSDTLVPWFQGILGAIGNAFSWVYDNFIGPVWARIKYAAESVANWFQNTLVPFFEVIGMALGWVFTKLYEHVIKPVWDGIKAFIYNAWLGIQTTFGWIKQGVQWVGDKFKAVGDWIGSVWTWLGNKLSEIWLWINTNVFAPLKTGVQWVGNKFRDIGNWIASVWNWLGGRLQAIWSWINVNVFAPMKTGIQWVGDKFRDIGNWIASVWRWLGDRLRDGFSWINSYVFAPMKTGIQWVGDKFRSVGDWIGRIWSWLGDTLRKGWTWINDYVFSPFKTGLGWLQDAFNNTKDGIKTAWDKLKAAVKDPVSFVVNSVINPFITGYNKINDFWQGADLGKIEGFARGGVLPGYQRAKRDDVMTPMRSGEGVLVPEVVRGLGSGFVHAANRVGNSGGVQAVKRWASQGFAKGGVVSPFKGRSFPLTQGYNRIHKGIDIGSPSGTPIYASADGHVSHAGPGARAPGVWGGNEIHVRGGGLERWFAHLSEIAVRVGQRVKQGDYLGKTGNTGISSGPHLHFGVFRGGWPNDINPQDYLRGAIQFSADDGSGGLAAIDPLSWVSEKLAHLIDGPMKKARDKFGGNKFSEMPLGIAGKMFDSVKQKSAELAAPFLQRFDDGIAGSKALAADPVARARTVMKWSGTVADALKHVGLPTSNQYKQAWLRQIQSESGGDPNAVQGNIGDINNVTGDLAKGLVQVIGSTFAAHRDPSLPNNQFDPLANLVAGMRYARSRYGAEGMLNVIGKGHGYALGGIVDHVWDDPVGTVQALKPGVSTIYNGTGRTEHFERVDTTAPGSGQEAHLHLHGAEYDESRMLRRGAEEWSRAFRKAGVAA